MNNQGLHACRSQERPLNKCVLDQLVGIFFLFRLTYLEPLQIHSRLARGQAADL